MAIMLSPIPKFQSLVKSKKFIWMGHPVSVLLGDGVDVPYHRKIPIVELDQKNKLTCMLKKN